MTWLPAILMILKALTWLLEWLDKPAVKLSDRQKGHLEKVMHKVNQFKKVATAHGISAKGQAGDVDVSELEEEEE